MGRVQGVGFRWNTKEAVSNYKVTGYVKNLSDGRVEILLEGNKEDISGALKAVEKRMGGYWTGREWEDLSGEAHFKGFKIIY